ncbi:LOW QUALITY PROTEIN: hypothetical protein V1478_000558 [Vespula squamosa]|uniref:Uncharacterized protein n=1 Tax=Vespula squamosa TaxID=30214 RepID=A0ABD2C5U8_VESSQ
MCIPLDGIYLQTIRTKIFVNVNLPSLVHIMLYKSYDNYCKGQQNYGINKEKYPKIMLMLYVIVLKKGIVKHSAETYLRVFDFIIAGLRVRIKIFKVRHMIEGIFQCVFHFGSVTKRI